MIEQFAYAGSLFVKGMHFAKAGESNEGHAHTYDHWTLLARGSVAVESNGRRSEFVANPFHLIFIPKGVSHRMIALQDDTIICCLHALHRADSPGDIIEADMIPAGTPPWSYAVPLLEADARARGINVSDTSV